MRDVPTLCAHHWFSFLKINIHLLESVATDLHYRVDQIRVLQIQTHNRKKKTKYKGVK